MEYTVLCTTSDFTAFSKSRTGWLGRGEESFIDATMKIRNFINVALIDFGYGTISIGEFDVREMVKNSFDSFMQKGLRPFTMLRLKVLITNEKMPNSIVIKIKDNGIGFYGMPPGYVFERAQLRRTMKPPGAFGGMGIGIWSFETKVQSMGGKLYFKNRKNGGAYVGIHFGRPESVTELEAEEFLFKDDHFA
jgi:hypothetical protein